MTTCGCGRKAEYEVYEHREPHCKECLLDAAECSETVLVRKIDHWEAAKNGQVKNTA